MEAPSRNAERANAQPPDGMLSVATAAKALGKSKSTVYLLIKRERINFIRVGRRLFVDGPTVQSPVLTGQVEPACDAGDSHAVPVPAGTGQGQQELVMPAPRGPRLVIFYA